MEIIIFRQHGVPCRSVPWYDVTHPSLFSLQGRWAVLPVAARPGVAGHERGGPVRYRRDDGNAGVWEWNRCCTRERKSEESFVRAYLMFPECPGLALFGAGPVAGEADASWYPRGVVTPPRGENDCFYSCFLRVSFAL